MSHLLRLFNRHPLVGNMLLTGSLFALGDGLAQGAEEKVFSPKRMFLNGVYGGIVFAPIAHPLYQMLGRIHVRGSTLLSGAARTLVDQTLWAPVGVALYLAWVGAWDGGAAGAAARVRELWWGTLLANWAVWPILQGVNFTVVPPRARLAVSALAGVLWNGYLSWRAHSLRRTDK